MPAVSLANAKRQALRIAEVSQNMVVSSLAVMRDDNDLLRNEIIKNEDTVDSLFDSIKLYGVKETINSILIFDNFIS